MMNSLITHLSLLAPTATAIAADEDDHSKTFGAAAEHRT
jgi:hypothetical protein